MKNKSTICSNLHKISHTESDHQAHDKKGLLISRKGRWAQIETTHIWHTHEIKYKERNQSSHPYLNKSIIRHKPNRTTASFSGNIGANIQTSPKTKRILEIDHRSNSEAMMFYKNPRAYHKRDNLFDVLSWTLRKLALFASSMPPKKKIYISH